MPSHCLEVREGWRRWVAVWVEPLKGEVYHPEVWFSPTQISCYPLNQKPAVWEVGVTGNTPVSRLTMQHRRYPTTSRHLHRGMPGAETLRDSAVLIELLKETRLWEWRLHALKVEFHDCPQIFVADQNMALNGTVESQAWYLLRIFQSASITIPGSVLVMTSNASRHCFPIRKWLRGLGDLVVSMLQAKKQWTNQGCWIVWGKQQVAK